MQGTNDELESQIKVLSAELRTKKVGVDDVTYKLSATRHELARRKEKDLKRESGVDLCRSDDYATLSLGVYRFSFGYERQMCLKHNDCTCEDQEWCFTVHVNGQEVLVIPESKLGQGNVRDNLLHGIGQFLLFIKDLTIEIPQTWETK